MLNNTKHRGTDKTRTELAKKIQLVRIEAELVRDSFITNKRNVEIQKICIEYLTPENVFAILELKIRGQFLKKEPVDQKQKLR